jgi:hypothetical protein
MSKGDNLSLQTWRGSGVVFGLIINHEGRKIFPH